MTIAGDHPESGLRFVLERTADGPPWNYQGAVYSPDARWDVRARVDAEGAVDVTLAASAPPALAEKVRLLLRTAFRQAQKEDEGAAPARKIVRWRGEK